MNLCVLVAVCVSRNVPFRLSKLLICQKVSLNKSLTDLVQTLSSSIYCQLLVKVEYWVFWALTVLAKQQPSRFWLEIFNQIWETMNHHLNGKISFNFSNEVNCKNTSQNFLKKILKLFLRFSMSMIFLRILKSERSLQERNLLLLTKKEFYLSLLKLLIQKASLKEKFKICLVESYNALQLV